MSLHVHTQTEDEDVAAAKAAAADASVADALATTVAADNAEDADATVHIELNFNAFADDVPPTQHARRAPSYTDPSIQDFADQALELAALRAELNRLTRDYDSLLYTLQLRDARLQKLQDELALARAAARDAAKQSASLKRETQPNEGMMAAEMSVTVDLPPPRIETPAQVPVAKPAASAPVEAERHLIPVDHEGASVALRREIMTIGRTKENDVCIPSRAVSRDHARLLMSPRSATIVDMNSANGCFVNDEPVKKRMLKDGDVLRIGDRSYRYAVSRPHAASAQPL